MRLIWTFLLIGFLLVSNAQLTIQPLDVSTGRSYRPTFNQIHTIQTNTLPFWDDFSITQDGQPDQIRIWASDTTRQWSDSTAGVFVNSTLAINPPSYKVVTFDGLDQNGQFYSDGHGLTDELYSDRLDLSAYTVASGVHISFYWQAGGNVERPDAKDSIRLEFYNINADTVGGNPWQRVWSQAGSDTLRTDRFYQEFIALNERFLNDTVYFRFQAFGDQDGPFDAWHLDWIYLDQNRNDDRLFYFDRGLTGQLTSPFAPFQSLPVHQALSVPGFLNGSQELQAFNLLDSIQATEYVLTLRNTLDNTLIDSMVVENILRPSDNSREITNTESVVFEDIDLTALPRLDSLVIESNAYLLESVDPLLNGTPVDLKVNDSIRINYLLHNYYAYDDGTAEYAVGTNQRGDQVGVQYWVNERDTLTGVDIYFPNIDPASNGETLILRILRNLADEIPIYSQDITVTSAPAINEFTSYPLTKPVIVSDTFYITYEQSISQYISVGLDRSNPAASNFIFQNISGQWERNNRIEGAMMIRPVFEPLEEPYVLSVDSPERLVIYPNPTHGPLSIEGYYERIELRDLSGKLIRAEDVQEMHNFSDLPGGLYLLYIYANSAISTHKIIVE